MGFHEGNNPALAGQQAIETSTLVLNNHVVAFYDAHANGSMSRSPLHQNGEIAETYVVPGSTFRFQFTFIYSSSLYTIALNHGDEYLYKSTDGGFHWFAVNGGLPILTHSADPANPYNWLANMAMAVDDNGVWHMMVEMEGGIGTVSATMTGDMINFDANRSASATIPLAGNPYMASIPGRGLLALYGKFQDPAPPFGLSRAWYITAATLPTNAAAWVERSDIFAVGTTAHDIADPHLVDLPLGGSMLTISVHQAYVYESFSSLTIDELYQALR